MIAGGPVSAALAAAIDPEIKKRETHERFYMALEAYVSLADISGELSDYFGRNAVAMCRDNDPAQGWRALFLAAVTLADRWAPKHRRGRVREDPERDRRVLTAGDTAPRRAKQIAVEKAAGAKTVEAINAAWKRYDRLRKKRDLHDERIALCNALLMEAYHRRDPSFLRKAMRAIEAAARAGALRPAI